MEEILEEYGQPVVYKAHLDDVALVIRNSRDALIKDNTFTQYHLTNKKKKQLYAINGLIAFSSVVGLLYTIKIVRDAQ